MKVMKNTMKTILIVIAITTIAGAYSMDSSSLYDSVGKSMKPIYRLISYSEQKTLSTYNERKSFESPISRNLVLDFQPYADSFQEFVKAYPTFTLDVFVVAKSDATFGDAGKNKFGPLTYSTYCFDVDSNGYYVDFVDVTAEKSSAYVANVNIKIGFQKVNTMLFVVPYMMATLQSHGVYQRDMMVRLDIKTITFNPR